MKTLTLRIENHQTLENGGPVAFAVPPGGAQIGRKAGMDWILPDQTRHISGHHFNVTVEGERFLLIDASSNGTFLHGARYRLDGPHEIRDGDRFTVGHYILRAEFTDAPAEQPGPIPYYPQLGGAAPSAQPQTPVQAPVQTPLHPANATPKGPTAVTPQEGPLFAPPQDGTPRAPVVPSQVPTVHAPADEAAPEDENGPLFPPPVEGTSDPAPWSAPAPAPDPSAEMDDVWGDFAAPPPPATAVQAPPSTAAGQRRSATGLQSPTSRMGQSLAPQAPDFSKLAQSASAGSITSAPRSLETGTGTEGLSRPPIPAPDAGAPDPAQGQPIAPTEAFPPIEQPGGTGGDARGWGLPAETPPASDDLVPQSRESLGLTPHPVAQAPAAAPQQAVNLDGDAFLRAFLEGAGVTDASALQIPPQQLARMLGQLARTGTNELMQMLQDRAAVKLFVSNEDRTMRVASGNNPMKFMVDRDQAFEAMFLAPREGYQTGAEGFENALRDVRTHQAAVIAALQPALAEILDGLSPDDIEGDMGKGMLSGGGRKSWDEFVKRWEARAAQGENGMLDAFVKAFSAHYGKALRKL